MLRAILTDTIRGGTFSLLLIKPTQARRCQPRAIHALLLSQLDSSKMRLNTSIYTRNFCTLHDSNKEDYL